MSFDWKEYLDLANFLELNFKSQTLEEAALRASVSRTYYAAFNKTIEVAINHIGFQPKRLPEDHGNLLRDLDFASRYANRNNYPQSSEKFTELRKKLKYMRDRRNYCDYIADLPEDLYSFFPTIKQFSGDVFNILAWIVQKKIQVVIPDSVPYNPNKR